MCGGLWCPARRALKLKAILIDTGYQQAAELRKDLLRVFIAETEQNLTARTTRVLMGSHGDAGYLMIGSSYSTSVSPFLAMRSS